MRIPGGTTPAGGRRGRPVRAVLACLPLLVGAGCSSDGGSSASPADDPPAATPSSVEAFPEAPHATGPTPLTVRAALAVVGEEGCVPGARRLCSADGSEGWAPIGDPARVTLVAARTHPADRHTTWTVLMRFSRDSRAGLRSAAREAEASGGVVLVLERSRVLAAVPPPGLRGTLAALEDLDQPTAWGLVEAIGAP